MIIQSIELKQVEPSTLSHNQQAITQHAGKLQEFLPFPRKSTTNHQFRKIIFLLRQAIPLRTVRKEGLSKGSCTSRLQTVDISKVMNEIVKTGLRITDVWGIERGSDERILSTTVSSRNLSMDSWRGGSIHFKMIWTSFWGHIECKSNLSIMALNRLFKLDDFVGRGFLIPKSVQN